MDDLVKKMLFIARTMATRNFEFMKTQGYGKMGFGQVAIAKVVLDEPGVYADDICKKLELDKATVAIGIKRLITNDFMRREVDELDKRKKKLFASPKLNDIALTIEKQINARMLVLTKGFSQHELEIFNTYLDRMKNNLLEESDF